MTLSSPFIHNPFDWLPAEVPKFNRNREIGVLPHCGKEMRKASAAIGRFAKSAVHAARGDHHVDVGGPHPVDGGMDVAVGDGLAMTHDHPMSAPKSESFARDIIPELSGQQYPIHRVVNLRWIKPPVAR
jgi:hypothetical protein